MRRAKLFLKFVLVLMIGVDWLLCPIESQFVTSVINPNGRVKSNSELLLHALASLAQDEVETEDLGADEESDIPDEGDPMDLIGSGRGGNLILDFYVHLRREQTK